ncbi:MAG: glycosyltransferase [Nitrososphaerota archaeon]|jgi:glycosyltransferase involved in cell wall biosynthesis|nr:glycosyltransferase [Nitrososphaerota archaeon]
MTPFLTVGICVRNGETLLSEAIESVLRQEYPKEKLQIIFVDDGSQDNTPKIIRKYTALLGQRAKTFKTSCQGLGHARNYIVNNADGEYILFVDADEILTPNYIKAQVEVMQKNPQVGITAGVFKIVPGNLMLNLEIAPHIVNQKNFGKPKSFIWKTDKLVGTGGTTFRTSAVRQVHGFDENIKGAGEDTDLILRMRKAGWLLEPNAAELFELHSGLSRPSELWQKYYWYGYGCQKSFQQTCGGFSFLRMSPMAGVVSGIFYLFPAYRFLRQKQMFLLPLHFGFKHVAWMFGFMWGQHKNGS